MSGANKILKTGQVVFKAGEAADGMYLVRKGELIVYLEQDGKEVILAKVGEGGMIGEMALFDRQPRSASVKAAADSEVTLITLEDFAKLMKQIPKWFVSLMSALSGRLRTTNDRLKQMETNAKGGSVPPPATAAPSSSSQQKPYQGMLRMVAILELLWHRDGTKDGKEWSLNRKSAEEVLVSTFNESPSRVTALLDALVQEQILASKVDQYKNPILAMSNRGALRQFAEFVTSYVKANPNLRSLPSATMTILNVLHKLSDKAPYDQFTCSAEDLIEEARTMGLDPGGWGPALKAFVSYGDTLKVVKSSSKSGLGYRVAKADFPALVKNLQLINRLAAAKLDEN